MSKIHIIINDFSMALAREGCVDDFSIKLPANIFYQLCQEVQQHSGKYLRAHPDGSIEAGKTIELKLASHTGYIRVTCDE